MRLALLLILSACLAFAEEYCAPPSCRVDSNCRDEIHSIYDAKCCGGVCVRPPYPSNRLIGEYCTPSANTVDYGESCNGACGFGLFCSTRDERCHAKHGVGCNCTDNEQCLSGICRAFNASGMGEQRLCAGVNSPEGEVCVTNGECSTRWCLSGKCAALPLLEACFPYNGFPRCATGANCRMNASSMFQCQSLCGVDVAGCCLNDGDCPSFPRGLQCNSSGACAIDVPIPLPGLDESCSFRGCNETTDTLICASNCNETVTDFFGQQRCGGPSICQRPSQQPDGAFCSDERQCSMNSTCAYTPSNLTCQPSPAPPPLYSVPLGEICGFGNYAWRMCQPPGDMCQSNGTHYVCKQSGKTPIGERCDPDDTFRTDECVPGSSCVANGTRGGFLNYLCTPPIAEGGRCEVSNNGETRWALCASGRQNCQHTTMNTCPCDQNTPSGQPCCACLTPKTVPDGGTCDHSVQCAGVSSLCFPNNTCVNVAGSDCNTPDDCGCEDIYASPKRCVADTLSGKFDCNCNRQCYQLRKPTPSPTTVAPTRPTNAPPPIPPTPGRCDAQYKAWFSIPYPPPIPSKISYNNFDFPGSSSFQLIPTLLEAQLNTTEQRLLIDLLCCLTCFQTGTGDRFNSHIYRGYQVDCGSKALIKLDNTCNDLRNSLALLNCWVLSPASTLHLSVGAFLMAAAFMQ